MNLIKMSQKIKRELKRHHRSWDGYTAVSLGINTVIAVNILSAIIDQILTMLILWASQRQFQLSSAFDDVFRLQKYCMD